MNKTFRTITSVALILSVFNTYAVAQGDSSHFRRIEQVNKYIDDYYEINDTKLYISSGLGTDKYKMRAFNKPSFNVYKLRQN